MPYAKEKKCKNCNCFFVYNSFPSVDRKFCSRRCFYIHQKNFLNKGVFKRGLEHPKWKGDLVGYTALHEWVSRTYGKLNFCEMCQRSDKKQYDWANISGEYKRKRSDWLRLCRSCHQKYDKIYEKIAKTKGWNTLYGKSL